MLLQRTKPSSSDTDAKNLLFDNGRFKLKSAAHSLFWIKILGTLDVQTSEVD